MGLLQFMFLFVFCLFLYQDSLCQELSDEDEEIRYKRSHEPDHEPIPLSTKNIKLNKYEKTIPRPQIVKPKQLNLLLTPDQRRNTVSMKLSPNSKVVAATNGNVSAYVISVNNNLKQPTRNQHTKVEDPKPTNKEEISDFHITHEEIPAVAVESSKSENKTVLTTNAETCEKKIVQRDNKLVTPCNKKNNTNIVQKEFHKPENEKHQHDVIEFIEETNDIDETHDDTHDPEMVHKTNKIIVNKIVDYEPSSNETIHNEEFDKQKQNHQTDTKIIRLNQLHPNHVVNQSSAIESGANSTLTHINTKEKIPKEEATKSSESIVKPEKMEPTVAVKKMKPIVTLNKISQANHTEDNEVPKNKTERLKFIEISLTDLKPVIRSKDHQNETEDITLDQKCIDGIKMEPNESIIIENRKVEEVLERYKYPPKVLAHQSKAQLNPYVPQPWNYQPQHQCNQYNPYEIMPNVYNNQPNNGYNNPNVYNSDYTNMEPLPSSRSGYNKPNIYNPAYDNRMPGDNNFQNQGIWKYKPNYNNQNYNYQTPYNYNQHETQDKYKDRIWRTWKNMQIIIKRNKKDDGKPIVIDVQKILNDPKNKNALRDWNEPTLNQGMRPVISNNGYYRNQNNPHYFA